MWFCLEEQTFTWHYIIGKLDFADPNVRASDNLLTDDFNCDLAGEKNGLGLTVKS